LIILGGISPGNAALNVELEELGRAIRDSFLIQAILMASAIPFSLSRLNFLRPRRSHGEKRSNFS